MNSKDITHLTFIDVETTGHDPNGDTDAIIEVAISRVCLKTREVTAHFSTLITPEGSDHPHAINHPLDTGWDLGPYHIENGHFQDVDWRHGMPLGDALKFLQVMGFEDGATIAGQNPHFDLRYLKRDFALCDRPWPALDYHIIDLCSPALFLVMNGTVPGVSLRHLIPWAYGEPNRKQQHRAVNDVEDTIRVFWALYDQFTGAGDDPIPYVLNPGVIENACPARPRRFWSGQTCKLPGIYRQYRDSDGKPVLSLDCHVKEQFPPSLNNHHFELLCADESI